MGEEGSQGRPLEEEVRVQPLQGLREEFRGGGGMVLSGMFLGQELGGH